MTHLHYEAGSLSHEHIGCGFRRVEKLLTGGPIHYPSRREDPAGLVVTFVCPQVLALNAEQEPAASDSTVTSLTRCSPWSPRDEPRLPPLASLWRARRADERYCV